jgi:hypothetical protein
MFRSVKRYAARMAAWLTIAAALAVVAPAAAMASPTVPSRQAAVMPGGPGSNDHDHGDHDHGDHWRRCRWVRIRVFDHHHWHWRWVWRCYWDDHGGHEAP